MRFAIACLLALAATVLGAPVRPTPVDITVRNGGPNAYTWYEGHTADQAERDAMELQRIGVAWPEAVLVARATGCTGVADQSVLGMARLFRSLLPIYPSNTLLPSGGTWFIGTVGHYYNDEENALGQLAACLVHHVAAVPPAMQVILDLPGNAGSLRPPPTEPYNGVTAHFDTVSSQYLRRALTPTQRALLLTAMGVHDAVTACKCGTGPCPGGNVGAAHYAFEASALETERHFFQIPPFTTAVDPGWSAGEECKLRLLTDQFHHAWGVGVNNGDWGVAYTQGLFHLMAHVALAIGTDDDLRFTFPCGKPIESCPAQTARQVIGE